MFLPYVWECHGAGKVGMIRYALKCEHGHAFDSWFPSAAAYDDLAAQGRLACAVCGDARVGKALMAPAVAAAEPARPLSAPASPAEAFIAALRRKVEAEGEDVGRDFARVARDIHEGVEPVRLVYGEASALEARALIEDGVPVAPLPWRAARAN